MDFALNAWPDRWLIAEPINPPDPIVQMRVQRDRALVVKSFPWITGDYVKWLTQ